MSYRSYGRAFKLVPTYKKDGTEGKPRKEYVFLNAVIDSENVPEGLFSIDPTKSMVKTITFTNGIAEDIAIPELWHGRVFLKNSTQEVKGALNLIECKGTPNLKELYTKAKEHPTYRFYGGCLLAVEGVPVGMFDEGQAKEFGILGKEEPNLLFTDGKYDMFSTMELSEVEDWGEELVKEYFVKKKKVATKVPNIARPKKPKKEKVPKEARVRAVAKPKVNKKKEVFSSIFSEKVDF
jgi:hypothetical protein